MFSLIFLSLLIGVSADLSVCPTNVTCIGKESCCQTTSGLWACCPIEDGICCNDGVHCCSKNEKCLSNGSCSSSTNQISFAFPLRIEENQLKSVPCPDGNTCDDGSTCCELSSGQYACCPHPDAVCCSDHIHCCPKDHTCDLERGHCRRTIDETNNIPCPDGQTACPDDYTCCLLKTGGYGCCPSADAVCCQDQLHCCPHGQVCDLEHGRCAPQISIPWLTKTPASPRTQRLTEIVDQTVQNLSQLNIASISTGEKTCPDAKTMCESQSTCCLTPETTWGCCPIENAVCCSDHKHCCPTHYKCDLHIFKCDHDTLGSIPMLKKEIPLHKISSKIMIPSETSLSLSTMTCPDGSACPEETTCCQLQNGVYGCCPYSKGSCCSDKVHCCPNEYSCDASGDRCVRRLNSFNQIDIIPSASKLDSIKKANQIKKLILNEDEICPDGKSKCSLNSTCCPNKDQNPLTYSCCPYTKGVCCGSNGSVCCPNNYDCNEEQLSCELRDSILLRKLLLTDDYYQCGSSSVSCTSDQTCCATYGTSSEDFACCPYTDGQCCSDGGHCCPNGSTCDTVAGGCL